MSVSYLLANYRFGHPLRKASKSSPETNSIIKQLY